MALINTHRIVINVARIAIPDSKALRMLPVSKLLRLGQHQIAAKFFVATGPSFAKKNLESYEILFFGLKLYLLTFDKIDEDKFIDLPFFSFDKKVKKNSPERKESLKSFFSQIPSSISNQGPIRCSFFKCGTHLS